MSLLGSAGATGRCPQCTGHLAARPRCGACERSSARVELFMDPPSAAEVRLPPRTRYLCRHAPTHRVDTCRAPALAGAFRGIAASRAHNLARDPWRWLGAGASNDLPLPVQFSLLQSLRGPGGARIRRSLRRLRRAGGGNGALAPRRGNPGVPHSMAPPARPAHPVPAPAPPTAALVGLRRSGTRRGSRESSASAGAGPGSAGVAARQTPLPRSAACSAGARGARGRLRGGPPRWSPRDRARRWLGRARRASKAARHAR